MDEESSEGEPLYLEIADALELYAAIIDTTVEQAGDHLRNRDGLESALARPRSYAHYENADISLQSAALSRRILSVATAVATGQH